MPPRRGSDSIPGPFVRARFVMFPGRSEHAQIAGRLHCRFRWEATFEVRLPLLDSSVPRCIVSRCCGRVRANQTTSRRLRSGARRCGAAARRVPPRGREAAPVGRVASRDRREPRYLASARPPDRLPRRNGRRSAPRTSFGRSSGYSHVGSRSDHVPGGTCNVWARASRTCRPSADVEPHRPRRDSLPAVQRGEAFNPFARCGCWVLSTSSGSARRATRCAIDVHQP